jgi:guanylate kinase
MLVLSSPSGAGKTSIAHGLLELEPELTLSVSVTTRPKRPGERDGVDYYFIDRARYDAMVRQGELLEHAEVYDHGYGTPRRAVETALAGGRDVLFDIDWQGTQQLREVAGEDMVSVFILDQRARAPSVRPAPGQRGGSPQAAVQGRRRRHPLGRIRLRRDQQRPGAERAAGAGDPGGRASEAPSAAGARRFCQPVPLAAAPLRWRTAS